MIRPTVLALDLEGTLISNAASQIPRPGLFRFLEQCHALFPRVVMFTTVDEPRFRRIAELLVQEGLAPPWFAALEHVTWSGSTKDLANIVGADLQATLLVDDFAGYVHPGQHSQWVEAQCFAHPYSDLDTVLADVVEQLHRRLNLRTRLP
jgi:hypothetical protein